MAEPHDGQTVPSRDDDLLALDEEAQRMPSGIEHHPQP